MKIQNDVFRHLSPGRRICASGLVVGWGLAFFMIATLAGLAAMACCGLVLGYLGPNSELFLDLAGVISGVVFLLGLVLLLRWEKRREFILRTSVAVVHRFGKRDEHKT